MKIIRRRERHERVSFFLLFDLLDEPGRGLSFPCSESGEVDVAALQPAGRRNYEAALGAEAALYHPPTIERSVNRWTEPAIGICVECGAQVTLRGFTNTCECGADYNGSGSLLAPREQWGEETGESEADILSVDYTSTDDLLEGR